MSCTVCGITISSGLCSRTPIIQSTRIRSTSPTSRVSASSSGDAARALSVAWPGEWYLQSIVTWSLNASTSPQSQQPAPTPACTLIVTSWRVCDEAWKHLAQRTHVLSRLQSRQR